jgi:hypothetical protein
MPFIRNTSTNLKATHVKRHERIHLDLIPFGKGYNGDQHTTCFTTSVYRPLKNSLYAMSWNSWECRLTYRRHRRVSVVRVGYQILIGLLPRMKKLLNNSIPCCSLLGLIDPLWLPVGCRSYSEHSGRSDRQMMPTMTTMIIVVWYNCCGIIAQSSLPTRTV